MLTDELISKINMVKEAITFLPEKDQVIINEILDKNLPSMEICVKIDTFVFYSESEKRGIRLSVTKTMQRNFSLKTKYVKGLGEEWFVKEKGKEIIILSKKEFWSFLDNLPNWIMNSLMQLRAVNSKNTSKTTDLVVKTSKKIIHTEIIKLALIKFPQLENYQICNQ